METLQRSREARLSLQGEPVGLIPPDQLAKSIIHSNIPPSTASGIAVSYIAKVMESITGVLQDDWKSYSVIIGHKGDTISPLSLLNIKKTELEFSRVKPESGTAVTDYAIAAKALMVYRIAQAPAAQMGYKAELVRRIGEVFKMEPFNLDSTAGVMNVPHWIQDQDYCILVSAVDMFFRKFPNHKFEKYRACTLGTFLKDCVVITSLNQAAQCLSIEPAVLLQYVFSKDIADDVRRLIGGGPHEEKNVDHSYFQYMREMNLIPRSPYSASINPNLFTWCQFIGVLMGKRRSVHARLLDCFSPSMLLVYASYVVYYIS
uniref:Bm14386 n=1 Tax=Brugia malayi TaxID=6279 RepID=A0A1I9G106_BRUMA|nr:Bm14386 [Brugia malayi]